MFTELLKDLSKSTIFEEYYKRHITDFRLFLNRRHHMNEVCSNKHATLIAPKKSYLNESSKKPHNKNLHWSARNKKDAR